LSDIINNLLPTYCPGGMSEYNHWHLPLGGIYQIIKGHIVGLFRQPEQRAISQYYNKISSGALKEEDVSMLDYAKSVAGLQFQYILSEGLNDGFPLPVSPSPTNVALALRRIREGFAFVGLTDEWGLSVCLFHAKFGAECQAFEFNNIHLGAMRNSSTELYDTSALRGWVDVVDSEIFAEASQIFQEDMQRFDVSSLSCAQWCWPESVATDSGA